VTGAGTTPAETVDGIRCEMARSLLQTTDLQIFQIASQIGFGSESALRRALPASAWFGCARASETVLRTWLHAPRSPESGECRFSLYGG
jgi:AraC-like DNA-binding protein